MRIAGVLLAAGTSQRFGGDKLLADLDGVPLLRWAAQHLAACGLDPLVAVVSSNRMARAAAIDGLGYRIVTIAEPERGQGRSLATGVGALTASCAGALILPSDMPDADAALLGNLTDAFAASGGRAIVHMQLAGQTGRQGRRPPVLWPSDLFGELEALDGDTGGRHVIERHVSRVLPVNLSAADAWKLDDIDTPEDLAACVTRRRERRRQELR
ncbi:MAG: NTP transferase domain-containing protein [Hyphomicrobiaceae bacterium]